MVELCVTRVIVSLDVVHGSSLAESVDLPQSPHILHDVRVFSYMLLVALEVDCVNFVKPDQGDEQADI